MLLLMTPYHPFTCLALPVQTQVKSVYVSGLPDTTTEDKLREVFGTYGEVRSRALQPATPLPCLPPNLVWWYRCNAVNPYCAPCARL
jgi:RNA recognition motif-containing protein